MPTNQHLLTLMRGSLRHQVSQLRDTLRELDHCLSQMPDTPMNSAISNLLGNLAAVVKHTDVRTDKIIKALEMQDE